MYGHDVVAYVEKERKIFCFNCINGQESLRSYLSFHMTLFEIHIPLDFVLKEGLYP